MAEVHPPERDYDLERIEKVAREGLAVIREGDPTTDAATLSVDTFLIVVMTSYRTPDGEEREATSVLAETRKRYVQVGMLEAARERLGDSLDPDYEDDE